MSIDSAVIDRAISYIQNFFAGDSSGHDAFHSLRVYKTALAIAERENADQGIAALAALLHDVDDAKLSPATCAGKENAAAFLRREEIPEEIAARILHIIDQVSFRGTDSVIPDTIEGKCVQDADRLDALGAIGIARTFAYGGSRGRALYDPAILPALGMDEAAYRAHVAPSLNHFYEKLFLLKDMMATQTGRAIAEKRDAYMHTFVEEFLAEWEGIPGSS